MHRVERVEAVVGKELRSPEVVEPVRPASPGRRRRIRARQALIRVLFGSQRDVSFQSARWRLARGGGRLEKLLAGFFTLRIDRMASSR
jgi:hypothetical protein